MILYPKSKINVGLQIIEKRPDGFHNLESLFLGLSQLSDILEIIESDKLSLSLYGIVPDCSIEDNLCVKAYRLLEKDFKVTVYDNDRNVLKKAGPGIRIAKEIKYFVNELKKFNLSNAFI